MTLNWVGEVTEKVIFIYHSLFKGDFREFSLM